MCCCLDRLMSLAVCNASQLSHFTQAVCQGHVLGGPDASGSSRKRHLSGIGVGGMALPGSQSIGQAPSYHLGPERLSLRSKTCLHYFIMLRTESRGTIPILKRGAATSMPLTDQAPSVVCKMLQHSTIMCRHCETMRFGLFCSNGCAAVREGCQTCEHALLAHRARM